MARERLLWYPMYPSDFDTDENVRMMTDEEIGFYIRCLNHAWIEGSIPDNFFLLAKLFNKRVTSVKKIWPRISKCFVQSDVPGRLVNPRQERERKVTESRTSKAQKAARARWGSDANASFEHQSSICKTNTQSMLTHRSSNANTTQHNTTPLVENRGFSTELNTLGNTLQAAEAACVSSSASQSKKTFQARNALAIAEEDSGRHEAIGARPRAECRKEKIAAPGASKREIQDQADFGKLLWPELSALAQRAHMQFSTQEASDLLKFVWRKLDMAQREQAVEGIRQRVESGEYENPQYVPTLRSYLERRLWERPLRPRPPQQVMASTPAIAYLQKLARGEEP